MTITPRRRTGPRLAGLLVLSTILAAAASCGGGGGADSAAGPPAPVLTTVKVSLSPGLIAVGQLATATASGLDQNGAAMSVGTVTWSSTAPTIAAVSSTGSVTGVAAGTASIVATVGSKTGQASVVVTQGTVTAVTLSSPGQSSAFLTSSAFNAALAVTAGSQYLITIVNTAPSYTIREDFTLSGSFASTAPPPIAPAISGLVTVPVASRSAPAGPTYDIDAQSMPDPTAVRSLAQNHLQMLDENRRTFARLGNLRALRARMLADVGRSAVASAAPAPVSQTIGTVNKVYVRNTLGGNCTTVDSIGARTVAVGQHVIVLADTNLTTWTQALRPDSSYYQTFASEFDQVTYPHIVSTIGNPLGYDAFLSGIGKVIVTITPVLNHLGGLTGGGAVVAFVNGCDFGTYTAGGGGLANYSNQTEMFYAWTPGSNGYTVPIWQLQLRATAAHEVKHIVSYTDRILNNSPVGEEIWLEEGLAQESEEIWERNFNQATWKSNANFLQTVACEINLGANAPCDQGNNKPYALIGGHLPFFFSYLQAESGSNAEGLGLDTPANYGAGWTIARWATDQYATSEAAFIKSLINDPTLSGLANLSAHTGQSIPLLLTYWNVATAIFQLPGYAAADVRTTIPSFNFADIFNVGQTRITCNGTPCGIFTNSGFPVYPVAPIPFVAGTLNRSVIGVPGTAASFFLLSASSAGVQSLQLLNGSGGALSGSSGLRVAILRVQ